MVIVLSAEGYWGRVIAAASILASSVALEVVFYFGLRNGDPAAAVALATLIPLTLVAMVAGWLAWHYTKARPLWVRAKALSNQAGSLIGLVTLDSDGLAILTAQPQVSDQDWSQATYVATTVPGALRLWTASSVDPVVVIQSSDFVSAQRGGLATTASGSGELELRLGRPEREVTLNLVGPLWGSWPATPRQVDRAAESMEDAFSSH